MFDHRLRPLLGATARTDTPVNETDESGGHSAWPDGPFEQDGSRSTDKPVVCLDLADFREAAGQEFFGIIGMDWLEKMTFEIDPDRERISFLRPGRLPPPMLSRGTPLEIEEGRLWIRASVGGFGSARFKIDTGLIGNGRILPGDLTESVTARTAKSVSEGVG